jgi:hypothetical protein
MVISFKGGAGPLACLFVWTVALSAAAHSYNFSPVKQYSPQSTNARPPSGARASSCPMP